MTSNHITIAMEKPPLAVKVAETGLSLARAVAATVTLIRLSPPALTDSSDALLSPVAIAAQSRQRPETLLPEPIPQFAAGVRTATLVLQGGTEGQILTAIADRKPDLVVLGTHAKAVWQGILLGSIFEDIVRHAPRPIRLVRRESDIAQ
ncbi:MAG: universal stress protein [Leptolyngbyaceae cyanobacterium]